MVQPSDAPASLPARLLNSSGEEQPASSLSDGIDFNVLLREGFLNGTVNFLVSMTFQGELNLVPNTPIIVDVSPEWSSKVDTQWRT